MKIFVLGTGGTGSLLALLLEKHGHDVWCGDRDPERAHRFLGKHSRIEVREVNARNLWGIVKNGRGCQLLVNASPAIFNEIILRAALRLGVHYLDLNSRLTRNPFKAEQLHYAKRFEDKGRVALINCGVAPGLTNLLVKRGAELLDKVDTVKLRLLETTESRDPVSTWSADVAFDAAVSHPRFYRYGKFHLGKRFGEPEYFRFPGVPGETRVYLAAQDEVATLPLFIPMRDLDVKIGGKDIEQMRRWQRRGMLRKSGGHVAKRFPSTPTPRMIASLIRAGKLENAQFAAAVLVEGLKREERLLLRWDAHFPTLYQLRQRGLFSTPISYATAHLASLFVKYFPRTEAGVIPPEALPADLRRKVLKDVKGRGIRLTFKMKYLASTEEEGE
jgi:saccharopine dehydrogenase (NAD+, L-lysine-forming)